MISLYKWGNRFRVKGLELVWILYDSYKGSYTRV